LNGVMLNGLMLNVSVSAIVVLKVNTETFFNCF
jgi:hypothetical protein